MDMSVARTELEKRTEFRVIGNSTTRHDAYEKVTGSATFGTDLSFPKMLHGKILWSKVAHARLVKTDTSKAEQLPGVKAIITANDFPEVRFGSVIADQTVLARGKVVWVGQPVAAIAATTLEIAERAAEVVAVEYEELPIILDPIRAMDQSSQQIHDDVKGIGVPDSSLKNVASYTRVHRGNPDRVMSECDSVVEEEYETQMAHQCYIEPQAAAAS